MATGDWWRHGVVYQVYPRSFADADGDGVGDLPGVGARLGYLAWLGIDVVWLSPFYRSPMRDFGYDVADHCDVDPLFGTLADFDRLLAAAHALRLRLLVDFVPNHTSDQHPWFAASRSARDSPKRGWYVWADPRPGGAPPNNWPSAVAGAGPAWTLDPRTGQCYLHSYLAAQPDLNWREPQVREAMDGVLRFWLDHGVDGFRMDAVHRLVKDRLLRDNPPEVAGHRMDVAMGHGRHRNIDQPEVHEVLRGFRRTLDEYGDRLAIGEVGLFDPARVVRYLGDGDELHLAFNLSFWQQPWSAAAVRDAVERYEAALPPGAWPQYSLGSHDVPRLASRLGAGGDGQARARVAAMLLLTLRGTPSIYYGDELGMTDGQVPAAEARDPGGRDPVRTPMQWDASPGAGFTSGRPWLPVPASAQSRNVAAQRGDPRSLLRLYRRLLRLRAARPSLHRGGYERLGPPDEVVLWFRRAWEGERTLVALNFSAAPALADAPGWPSSGRLELSTDPLRPPGPLPLRPLALGPLEGMVIRLPHRG